MFFKEKDYPLMLLITARSYSSKKTNMDTKEQGLKIFQDLLNFTQHSNGLLKKLNKIISDKDAKTEDGISLLDVKNQLLLRYIMNAIFLMLKKTDGQLIEGDSAIDRLIELRVTLERIRPLEEKLKYQIDKMIKIASTGVGDPNDSTRFRANPDNMVTADENHSDNENEQEEENKQGEEEKTEDKDGIYVPPKLSAVHYDLDEKKAFKQQKMLERAKKYALNSSIVRELREEYLDTPIEVTATNSLKQQQDKYLKKKQEYEEEYFTRIPVPKVQKDRLKKISTLGQLGDELTRFEDISVLDNNDPILLKSNKRKRSLKKNSKKGKKAKKRKFR